MQSSLFRSFITCSLSSSLVLYQLLPVATPLASQSIPFLRKENANAHLYHSICVLRVVSSSPLGSLCLSSTAALALSARTSSSTFRAPALMQVFATTDGALPAAVLSDPAKGDSAFPCCGSTSLSPTLRTMIDLFCRCSIVWSPFLLTFVSGTAQRYQHSHGVRRR